MPEAEAGKAHGHGTKLPAKACRTRGSISIARLDFANLTRFRAALTAPILDHCAWPAPCADDQACVRVGSCTESDAIDLWVPSLHTSRNWLLYRVP